MKRDVITKQGEQVWVVTSGARFLPASLRQPLASVRPVPRPAPFRQRQRPYRPTRLSLIPLSRRPAYDNR
jgi:hypothetical protein